MLPRVRDQVVVELSADANPGEAANDHAAIENIVSVVDDDADAAVANGNTTSVGNVGCCRQRGVVACRDAGRAHPHGNAAGVDDGAIVVHGDGVTAKSVTDRNRASTRSYRAIAGYRQRLPRAPRAFLEGFTFGPPVLRRYFEALETETRRDGTADQGPVAQRPAACQARAGTTACGASPAECRRRAGRLPLSTVDARFQRRARMPVPDLDGVDAMPVRASPARQQKENRGRGGAALFVWIRGRSRDNARPRGAVRARAS